MPQQMNKLLGTLLLTSIFSTVHSTIYIQDIILKADPNDYYSTLGFVNNYFKFVST
jgi:hypothetical protein